jgi:hypothetical protein
METKVKTESTGVVSSAVKIAYSWALGLASLDVGLVGLKSGFGEVKPVQLSSMINAASHSISISGGAADVAICTFLIAASVVELKALMRD